MRIGSLLDNRITNTVTYSYHKRRMTDTYNPDNKKETADLAVYTKENGNLFFKEEVSWHDHMLLRGGVDIRFEMDERCFIDHIDLRQGESYITNPDVLKMKDSQFDNIEIFTLANGEEVKIGKYNAQTGSWVSSKEITISVGYYCTNLILRINTCCMPFSIESMDIWAAWELEDAIWPIPTHSKMLNRTFPLAALKTVLIENEDDSFAANYLNEKLTNKHGHAVLPVSQDGQIIFRCIGGKSDSFSLHADNECCVIEASNRRSILYGIDALLQVIDNGNVKCCHVENTDYKQIRGVHLGLPAKDQRAFLENLIKYVFVPMHYNMVFLQLSAAMRYDNFPEINSTWLSSIEDYNNGRGPLPAHLGHMGEDIWEKDELRDLVRLFENHGLEVVPEIQSFGHAQYITGAYPDLGERIDGVPQQLLDLGPGDGVPSGLHTHVMCTSHPRYYQVIFGLIDEVIDTIKPKRYIHMGHDEILGYGVCPICSKLDKVDILATEINTLNRYIKEKGYQMMIWGDMVQHQYYSTPTAINKIDKDIIMLDFIWYFHMDQDTEDNLLSHGFEVVMGNMYSSHYPRYESRIKKEHMLGAQVSVWLRMNEESYGYNGKMYEFIYSAMLMCNAEYRSDMRLTYNEIIKPLLRDLRYHIGGLQFTGTSRQLPLQGLRRNVPFDIRDITEYDTAVSLSATNSEFTLPVNDFADILTFTQAVDYDTERRMWALPYKIGEYVLEYQDGTTYTEDICYGTNIYKYKSVYGDLIPTDHFRHLGYQGTYITIPECGKTHDGEDFTLGKYSFKNPEPQKKIQSITLRHIGTTGSKIIIFDAQLHQKA